MPEQVDPVTPSGGNNAGFTPPATQEELNAIISARLDRERGKFADYDDVKAKAARLDELEEKNRTDLEKAEARAVAAEKVIADREAADAAAKADAEAAAALAKVAESVAAAKNVPVGALRGGTKEELEAHADLLAPLLGTPKPPLNYVPSSGTGTDQAAAGSFAAGRERAKARSK
ncbi:hypothetical protein [Leucobacter luti]|uniref:Scaffolding protein n=1 Tax=Leucobacter luti TaxID=340320 RepID=A0A4Q7U0I5_9MICO|nr:hypothetical protein [Leucobacter luti]RZT66743.1 hypothetical protein EV139_0870 [Leucobacter luti]